MAYSDEILEAAPERATKLLTGIGAVPTIRTLLLQVGMTDDEIAEGRKLLLACLAAPLAPREVKDTEAAAAQRDAVAELDAWDEPNFARYQAALRRHHPAVAEYVFESLSASTGVAAVNGVATFLARVDTIEKHTDPKRQDAKTKQDDAKAIKLLAKRGLDAKERARLKGLVHVALGPTSALPANLEGEAAGQSRKEALAELRAWYDDWASSAKAVVKKRAYLIRLGLATRKSPTKKKKAKPPQRAAAAPEKPASGAATPSNGAAKPADPPAEPAAPK